jgi:hypothetical protein
MNNIGNIISRIMHKKGGERMEEGMASQLLENL